MFNRPKSKIAVAIIVAAVVTAASFNIYFLRERSGGYAVWNPSEAYLFVVASSVGLHVRSVRYPWALFKEYVGAIEGADDDRAYLVVIRVSSSGVERHILKLLPREEGGYGGDPSRYTPIDGRVYAFCPFLIGQSMQNGRLTGNHLNEGLCWWAGDHFEKATESERRAIMPDDLFTHSRLTTGDFNNDANGWSRTVFGAGPVARKLTIDLNDKSQLLVDNVPQPGTQNGTLSIDLLQSGKPPERIGSFYDHDGRISRSEYKQAFQELR
jgi:hypothetical protein